MCTLIAIHRRVPGSPLVIAANRDEYLNRPAEEPRLRRTLRGPIVAPLDLRAGGTWLGLNANGVFSALTNLRCPEPDPNRKTRGGIVMDALGAGTADAAADALAALPSGAYNPFNCLVADRRAAYLVVYQEEPKVHELAPGVHVIGNADAAAAAIPKVGRVLEAARVAAAMPRQQIFKALADICRQHDSGSAPLDDTCVHAGGTYGTRSSVLLELGESLDSGRMLYSDGPPCTEPYEDYSALLHELRQAPGYGAEEIPTRTAS